MDELTIQTLIKAKYSGALSDMTTYISLALQATAVIFGGILLWRLSVRYQRKKSQERKRNTYFETTYSKGWKRK